MEDRAGEATKRWGRAAVYRRLVSYDDENYYLDVDDSLEALLQQWRAGGADRFSRAWRQANRQVEYEEEILSVHFLFSKAQARADVEHLRLSQELAFVDLGFSWAGAGTSLASDADILGTNYAADLPRLNHWCRENSMDMPELDMSIPHVKQACESIAARSRDGTLWLNPLADETAEKFAADMVADALRARGEPRRVGELFRYLVGDLTYVGPAPSFLRRLFRR